MLRTFAINRTSMLDTERTWLSLVDSVATHLDLQPAIAACRAASAGSGRLLVHPLGPPKIGCRQAKQTKIVKD
jgi:hypothetical protein